MKFSFTHSSIKAHYTDSLVVTVFTVVSFLLTRHFNLAERFYSWSRLWEQYQADELLFPLFTVCICLIWFSRRRYLEAKKESSHNTVLLSENRQLLHDLTSKQEHERLFLAQELHDVFSQYLAALRTNAEYIQILAGHDDYSLNQAVEKILANVNNLHQVTRSLLKTLRPPLLDFGIVMAIEDLVTEWQQTHKGIIYNLNFQGDEPQLNEDELLTLYRTIQEGLSNVIKHTHAKNVDILLCFTEQTDSHSSQVILTVINDGDVSFEKHHAKTGFGLIGIRERVSVLNGEFNIENYLPSGSKLTLSFPFYRDREFNDAGND